VKPVRFLVQWPNLLAAQGCGEVQDYYSVADSSL
jgi:hypothetical protein